MGKYLSLWKPEHLEAAMETAEENLDAIRGQLAARRDGRSTDP
jgi:hypothetical protein